MPTEYELVKGCQDHKVKGTCTLYTEKTTRHVPYTAYTPICVLARNPTHALFKFM